MRKPMACTEGVEEPDCSVVAVKMGWRLRPLFPAQHCSDRPGSDPAAILYSESSRMARIRRCPSQLHRTAEFSNCFYEPRASDRRAVSREDGVAKPTSRAAGRAR
jgi:hypothetical protein